MGKWAFDTIIFFKSAQIGKKGPKNTQKGPFSENASNFLSPLLFLKVGKKPTYLGKNPKNRPNNLQKSAQLFEKLKKPTLQKLKVGIKYVNF